MRRPAATAVATCLALAALLVSLPSAAQADEVATAQARVDQLQGAVRAVTSKLTDGTKKYEADQLRLKQAQVTLIRARKEIADVRAQADKGSAQLDLLAKQMYMAPASRGFQVAFTQGPDQIVDSLQMNDAVDQVAGSQIEIVRNAVAARVKLQADERVVLSLTAEAKTLTERSASRLRELNALASRTAAELKSAQSALGSARSRAEEAKARASRRRVTSFTGASCTGGSTSGQANGNLDPASLCPLWSAPGHRLRADAAAAFNAMSKFHAATAGGPLCVSDSYRSYGEQVDVYRRKPGLAAVPGNSNHGWGLAVDFCGGVERFGSAAYGWMTQNAGRFGFFHPGWAQQGGSKPEAWHWEFGG